MKVGGILRFKVADGSYHLAVIVKIHENGTIEIANGQILILDANGE